MKILCFGEIMLRLAPPDGLRFAQTQNFEAVFGGSEANVAASLSQFGLPSAFVTRLPDNELGRAALGSLARFGVDTSLSVFGGERLGLYFLEMGAGLRGSKVLYDRQNSGMATLAAGMLNWRKILKNVDWLHWSGITAALSQGAADALAEALQIANHLKIKISCDLNHREKLWKYGTPPAQIMPSLVEKTDVLLGDATVFDLHLGIRGAGDAELLQNVAAHFPRLQHVAMTHRTGQSASNNNFKGVLFCGGEIFQSRTYHLPDMLDRIGGGDAFMAGLIFGLCKNAAGPQQVVEFAAAAAALKHYVRGDFNLATEAEVLALLSGNTGGWVGR